MNKHRYRQSVAVSCYFKHCAHMNLSQNLLRKNGYPIFHGQDEHPYSWVFQFNYVKTDDTIEIPSMHLFSLWQLDYSKIFILGYDRVPHSLRSLRCTQLCKKHVPHCLSIFFFSFPPKLSLNLDIPENMGVSSCQDLSGFVQRVSIFLYSFIFVSVRASLRTPGLISQDKEIKS